MKKIDEIVIEGQRIDFSRIKEENINELLNSQIEKKKKNREDLNELLTQIYE